ncbi:MAG: PASTA domain-containing protein, partial [Egibacteraceae bacterium]
ITPSTGPIAVPDVSGRSPEDARASLAGAGLSSGERRDQASGTVQPGVVIGTDPAAGTPVGPETEVALIVSTGPSGITVPDVLGRDESSAFDRILDECPQPDCVVVRSQRVPSEDVEEGDVISSNPAAGEPAQFGSTVTLTVSDGPADLPSPGPSDPESPIPSEGPPDPSDGDGGDDDGVSGRGRGILGL